MKKYLISVALVALVAHGFAAEPTRLSSLFVGTKAQQGSTSVGAGELVVNGEIKSNAGLVTVKVDLWNITAASTYTILNNKNVASATLLAGPTEYTSQDFTTTFSTTPRCIDVRFGDIGTGTSTLVGTALVSGIGQKGDAVTETHTLNFGASAKVSTGSVVFATVSSVTFTITSGGASTTSQLWIGETAKIGLLNDLYATTDVIKIIEAGTIKQPAAVTLDTTNDSITFATAPNGSNDYEVIYKAVGK